MDPNSQAGTTQKSIGPQDDKPTQDELFIPTLNFRSMLIVGKDGIPHNHDFIEIFYVITGKIDHYANGEKRTLSIGDMVFLSPDTYHYFERSEPCTYRNLCITFEEFHNVCEFLRITPNFFLDPPLICTHISFSDMDFIESRIRKLAQVLGNLQEANIVEKALLTFVASIFITEDNPENIHDNFPPWLNRVLGLFYQKDIITNGLSEIKKHVYFSESYMYRTFKKYMGKTMLEYLNEVRIDYAAILLKNLNLSILQISNEVGFSSLGYFNKLFKKVHGVTPAQYRRKNLMARKD